MTYWGYHLLFTLPLIVLLLLVVRRSFTGSHWVCMCVTAAIAFVCTTPWDNYAVYLGIWDFGENVSLGYPLSGYANAFPWLGHIPFEEYAYFVIECVLTCLLLTLFIQWEKQRKKMRVSK